MTNPRRLKFLELEAAQLPRALDDVAVAQVSMSYLTMLGGDPHDALQFRVRTQRQG